MTGRLILNLPSVMEPQTIMQSTARRRPCGHSPSHFPWSIVSLFDLDSARNLEAKECLQVPGGSHGALFLNELSCLLHSTQRGSVCTPQAMRAGDAGGRSRVSQHLEQHRDRDVFEPSDVASRPGVQGAFWPDETVYCASVFGQVTTYPPSPPHFPVL